MLLLAVLVALATAAAPVPNHPQWPPAFSATVVIHARDRQRPDFARWFYDSARNIDKLDGMAEWEGELYFAERFFDHTANIQTDLFWQRDMVTCFRRPLRNPLPKPVFTNFTYAGQALIDYVVANHWVFRNGNDFFQFYDSAQGRVPMRFDAEQQGRPALTIQYREFDRGKQSKDIFSIPGAIITSCTNVNAIAPKAAGDKFF